MNWLDIVKMFAPLILANTKLAPIAPYVSKGIEEASQIKDASGPDKLVHAVNIAEAGIAATNAQAGKIIVDPTLSHDAITKGVGAVVDITKLIHANQPATQ